MSNEGRYIRAPLATEVPQGVIATPVAYSETALRQGSLVVPSASEEFLQRPPALIRCTPAAARLDIKDAKLVGFRTYIDEQHGYFIDEQLVFADATMTFARAQAGSESVEDTRTLFNEHSASVEDRERPVVLDEDVISLASGEPSNYGSWLYRILPKLFSIPKGDDRPVLVYQNTGWQKQLLDQFRSGREVVPHWPEMQYRLKSATIMAPRNSYVFFDSEILDVYRNHPAASGLHAHPKIYIERGPGGIRPIVNEQALIALLEARGFFIVRPGQISIADQIYLYKNARVIVCAGGSGLFNAVFARNCECVVDIEPGTDWLYAHSNLLQSCAIPHAVVFGARLDRSNVHSPWSVSVAAIARALDHFGT